MAEARGFVKRLSEALSNDAVRSRVTRPTASRPLSIAYKTRVCAATQDARRATHARR